MTKRKDHKGCLAALEPARELSLRRCADKDNKDEAFKDTIIFQ